jgi:hypothetical protein
MPPRCGSIYVLAAMCGYGAIFLPSSSQPSHHAHASVLRLRY